VASFVSRNVGDKFFPELPLFFKSKESRLKTKGCDIAHLPHYLPPWHYIMIALSSKRLERNVAFTNIECCKHYEAMRGCLATRSEIKKQTKENEEKQIFDIKEEYVVLNLYCRKLFQVLSLYMLID
jgi:hypothetical protein